MKGKLIEFLKKHWWKSDYKLPISFIIFFVLTFFLIGEQLPVLPLYLFGPGIGNGADKVHILDLNPSDALHHPIVYLLIGIIIWLLFRKFAWPTVWIIGGTLWTIDQLFLTPLDHRPLISGLPSLIFTILISFTLWGVLTLVPYFIYRTVDRKWGKNGRRNAILIVFMINIIFLFFFAFQIYVLHNSYNYLLENRSSEQQNQNSQNQTSYTNFAMITPYVNESYISSINEAFGNNPATAPWGFAHSGIDFMTETDLVPFQAATNGTITNLATSKNEQQGWHTGFCIDHNPYLVCYNFETFSTSQDIGDRQQANILVKNGDQVRLGDIIGRLVHGGSGTHVDFGVIPLGQDRSCPEPYFDPDAKASILRLIHKDHPTWNMCY